MRPGTPYWRAAVWTLATWLLACVITAMLVAGLGAGVVR